MAFESENKKEITLMIDSDQEDQRIDKVLTIYMENLSRSYLQKLLKDGLVFVNDKPVKANYKVKENDKIHFVIPDAIEPDIKPQDIPLSILYEDDDLLIVDKPKGMVVHPAPGHYTDTLVNAIMFHCKNKLSGINGVLRPGIVHRIDRDTTGSIMICKNDFSHQDIAQQLKQHSIHRVYHAIVCGRLKETEGTIEGAIGRDKKDRKKMAICSEGKPAITHYKVLKEFANFSYVQCQLETGRTHQIRVHMASIGHPLLGDEVYGTKSKNFSLNGQCLHAKILGFIHPRTGEYIEVDSPLPAYFQHLLEILK